jgi:hypothetical protein
MTGALVASAACGLLLLRTRRVFAWGDPMIRLMLVAAALMIVMCAALLLGGHWKAALFLAPLAGSVVVPAFVLGRVPHPPARNADDPEDDDGSGGGGGGTPPEDPPPAPPAGGLDWERFDEARASWGRPRTPTGA